jgi:TRAP-type C4-dicarboxylate transport system substrate-binding protein
VGAQPVTIQAAELTQALATGAVNAFMTSPATAYDSKIWEQLKHGYNVRGWLPKNLVIVNKKAFDALDKPAQEALLKAAGAAQQRGWQVSEEKTKFYLEQLAKNGLKVEQPSPALAADMKKIGETMIAEWAKQAGPDGQAVLDAYRK